MQNDDYRAVLNIAKKLHKKSAREETGLFLIEGHREIELAKKNGVEIIRAFDSSNTPAKIMERISYCGEVVAVAKAVKRNLQDFELPPNPLIVVLDDLEKPGNIGAIIRTADAAGVSAVFVCGRGSDLGNPNLIRASLGALFCVPVFAVTAEDAASFLERHSIPVVTASPDAVKYYYEHDFSKAVSIVIGSEADGVSEFWQQKAAESLSIPMTGEVNSLNASVSAAVLIYEAVKGRAQGDGSPVSLL